MEDYFVQCYKIYIDLLELGDFTYNGICYNLRGLVTLFNVNNELYVIKKSTPITYSYIIFIPYVLEFLHEL